MSTTSDKKKQFKPYDAEYQRQLKIQKNPHAAARVAAAIVESKRKVSK